MKPLALIVGICAAISLSSGCGSAETSGTNAAANNAAVNSIQNVDANNLPPGLSASPITPVNNTNAINSAAPGATQTPGIPDPKTLGKPLKPGATPTPGIPDPETLKRQMEEIRRTANRNGSQPPPPPAGAGDGSMMRSKRSNTNTNKN